MRVKKKKQQEDPGDMTAMIDIVFQLIAFFMVLINFTKAEQDQRIKLPISELVKVPEEEIHDTITLQLVIRDEDLNLIDLHQVLVAGQEKSIDELEPILRREFNALKEKDENAPANATIIIRADGDAPTGEVQKIIQMAQKAGFQKFSLRAKEKD